MIGSSFSVKECFKAIVALILSNGLQAGDRLPGQPELRAKFGKSNKTVSAAMDVLVRLGVVIRTQGSGTVVADPDSLHSIPWSVGLLTFEAPSHGPASFFANLHHRLIAELSRHHCACSTYVHADRFEEAPPYGFLHLAHDLDRGHLDGLLTLSWLNPYHCRALEQRGVPVCHVGPLTVSPSGVIMDSDAFQRQAVQYLMAAGRTRIVGFRQPEPHRQPGSVKPDKYENWAGETRITEWLPHIPGTAGGAVLADRLLAGPLATRPDGVVVPDDYAAAELTRRLVATPDYRPRIAVLTTRQLPLVYALPIARFEIDLDELVVRGIEVLRERMLGRLPADHIERVEPRLVDSRVGVTV